MPLVFGQVGTDEEIAKTWVITDDNPYPGFYINAPTVQGRTNATSAFENSKDLAKKFDIDVIPRTPASVPSPSGREPLDSPLDVTPDGFITPQPVKKKKGFKPVHSHTKKKVNQSPPVHANPFAALDNEASSVSDISDIDDSDYDDLPPLVDIPEDSPAEEKKTTTTTTKATGNKSSWADWDDDDDFYNNPQSSNLFGSWAAAMNLPKPVATDITTDGRDDIIGRVHEHELTVEG